MLLKIAIIWEMTHLLVTQHFKSIISSLIDQNWVQKFIDHYDTLKLKYNHKYDYQQAKCEDLKLIQVWFQHVQATIVKYSIHKNNIYNFDETDFQISIISTVKVITESN